MGFCYNTSMPSASDLTAVLQSIDHVRVTYQKRVQLLIERYSKRLEGRAAERIKDELKKGTYDS